MEFITYGHFVRRECFRDITEKNENVYLNKPTGGLWGSPINSEFGWKDWCSRNDFKPESFKVYTKWRVKDMGKILIINSYEDLEKAMDKYGYNPFEYLGILEYRLDFYKIKEDGYDGMMLTANGNWECHLPMKRYHLVAHINLNAWDCESIVVWNWNQIKVIEKGRVL